MTHEQNKMLDAFMKAEFSIGDVVYDIVDTDKSPMRLTMMGWNGDSVRYFAENKNHNGWFSENQITKDKSECLID